MKAIDLFCGAGGLSLGFQQAGYEIVAAFDNWRPALAVYQRNFTGHPAICYDLAAACEDVEIFTNYSADMVIGGPPCQDFSSAGKRDENQGRADLTRSFASIVTKLKPNWMVMENVERAESSKAFADAKALLKDAGYGLTEIVLDASLCGVPQLRKRLFLIAEQGGRDDALEFYLEKNLAKRPMTLRDYFGERLAIDHYYRHPRSYARRGVFSIDEPSPTIRGVNRPVPPSYQPHSGDTAPPGPELRPLTTKERSMIQTFPDSFIWSGTKADMEQLIGNAVPVKLAEYVARCIEEYVESKSVPEPIDIAWNYFQSSLALELAGELRQR